MGMNWSGFLGGISQGIQLGQQINGEIDRQKIRTVQEQGLAEARAAQAAAVDGAVSENGRAVYAPDAPANTQAEAAAVPAQASAVEMPSTQAYEPGQAVPAAAPTAMPDLSTPAAAGLPRKQFEVKGEGFDSKEDARKAAAKTVPTATEFFNKNAVPKIREAYLAQGNLDKAKAWETYAADEKTQKNAETWAQAFQYSQAGNWKKAGQKFVELHNHLDDDQTIMSTEEVKDKDGNATGFNLTVKDDKTGEKRQQFVGHDEMLQAGLAGLSPPAMFEARFKQQAAADAARAKAAADKASDTRDLNKAVAVAGVQAKNQQVLQTQRSASAVALEGIKSNNDLEKVRLQEKLRGENLGVAESAKATAKIKLLQEYGYDSKTITSLIPAIVGAGEYKKTTDPAERRAIVTTEMAKDPLFTSKYKTEEAQSKAIDQMMRVIQGDGASPGKGVTVPNPVAPPAAGLPTKGKGTAYLTPNGLVYR